MENLVRRLLATSMLALLAVPAPAWAQRAAENAVATADDAFGSSVGLEQTGIYSESDTRGFSPTKAGNGRIDGVYYDPVGALSARLRNGNAVRVGFAAEIHPFQAPTGIIEYRLRPFPAEAGVSLGYNFMAFGGYIREFDLRMPLARGVAFIGGMAQSDLRQSDGASNQAWGATGRLIARFGGVEVAPFVSHSVFTTNYAHPLAIVTGAYLPERPKVRRYLGQDWAKGRYDNHQMGGVIKAAITDHLGLRGGIFHAVGDKHRNYSELFTLQSPTGLARHLFIADPQQDLHSTSGEVRLAYHKRTGKFAHGIFAGFRARDRLTESGGSDRRDFGTVVYGERDPETKPTFQFSRVNVGRLRQSALMLGYIARIDDVGSINVGIQKARYRARFRDGLTGAVTLSRDDPWLYNATLAFQASRSLDFYAGMQKGLEDSGVAPDTARNRNEQLPATRTRQYEGGVRFAIPGGRMVVNAFEITKPYFTFDATNAFTQVGKVRHRGLEASLASHLGKRFSLLGGAVLMQPRVTGSARQLGLLGKRPAGTPSLYAKVDANYRTDIFGGLTPTASLTYTGKRAVGSRPQPELGGGQLMVRGYAALDLGLRQSFKVGKVPASFRFIAYNVFDAASWKVVAPNSIYMDERRRYNLSVTADF